MGSKRLTVVRYVGVGGEQHEAHVVESLTAAVSEGRATVTVPATVLEDSLQLSTADVETLSHSLGPTHTTGTESSVITAAGEERGYVLGVADGGVAMAQDGQVLFLINSTEAEVLQDARAHVGTVCDVEFSLATQEPEVKATLAYCLEGISWTAHYSVVVDLEHDRYDFVGKYSLTNNCGCDLENYDVELLACSSFPEEKTLHMKKTLSKKKKKRASGSSEPLYDFLSIGSEVSADFWSRGGAEVAYRLARPVTLVNGCTTSVTFTQGVIEPINKHHFVKFTVRGDRSGLVEKEEATHTANGEAVLEIQNLKEHGLGMALPFGELRVYNAGGVLSEASVGYMPSTSAEEVIRIAVGEEPGLTAKREVLSFTKSESKRTISEKIQLTVSNNSLTVLTVLVEDTVYRWHNWKVVEVEPDFHPNGTDKIRWVLPEVQVDTEETIVYTVVYSWDADAPPMPIAVPSLQ